MGALGLVLVFVELASERRPDAEKIEIVGGDDFARDELGTPVVGHDTAHHRVGGKPFERVRFGPHVDQIRVGGREMRKLLAQARVDLHQPIGVFDGKVFQQDGIHDAEDGGVETDAERERHRRNDGEPGLADKRPQSVAQVADEIVHTNLPGHLY